MLTSVTSRQMPERHPRARSAPRRSQELRKRVRRHETPGAQSRRRHQAQDDSTRRSAHDPAARLSAAIEVFADIEARRRPAADALKDWGLSHRFAGSGDRAAIAGLVYDALRRKASSAWLMGEADAARGADRHAAPRARARRRGDRGAVQRRALCAGAVDRSGAGGARRRLRLPTRRRMSQGDYPEWLDPYLARVFGDERAAEGAALASRAPLDLRVNTLAGTREDVLPKLAHLHAEPTRWSPVGLRIRLAADAKSPAIHAEPLFLKGAIEIQDEGSQLAALFAGAKPGEQVIDLCAGAGGKTLALAAAMENRGQIYATDIDKRRLVAIHDRIARAGARNIQVRTPQERGDVLGRSRRPRRSGADRRAMHRHRHLAAQSRRQVAHPPGRAGRAHQAAGRGARTRRRAGQAGRPHRLHHLFGAGGGERRPGAGLCRPPRRFFRGKARETSSTRWASAPIFSPARCLFRTKAC